MGWQIIKKENGKYALWSSIVDDFLYDDVSLEYLEVVYIFIAEKFYLEWMQEKKGLNALLKSVICNMKDNCRLMMWKILKYRKVCMKSQL